MVPGLVFLTSRHDFRLVSKLNVTADAEVLTVACQPLSEPEAEKMCVLALKETNSSVIFSKSTPLFILFSNERIACLTISPDDVIILNNF